MAFLAGAVLLWCAANVSCGLYVAFCSVLAGAGCLMFLLVHYITGARWSDVLRIPLQGLSLSGLGFGLVLGGGFLLFFPGEVYVWWLSGAPEAKRFYLTHAGVYGRLAGYSLVLFGLPLLLSVLAGQEIRRRGAISSDVRKKLRTLSAVGLPLAVAAGGMLSIDWVMAREVEWYSGLWPVHFWTMALLLGLSVLVLAGRGRLEERGRNDLGLWLLAAVLLHAYTAYSEGMLVWFARIPEEVHFLMLREPGWPFLLLTGLAGLAVPFVLLLLLGRRRRVACLTAAACLTLGGVVCEAVWWLYPGLVASGMFADRFLPGGESVFSLIIAGGGVLVAFALLFRTAGGAGRGQCRRSLLLAEEAKEPEEGRLP